MSNLRTARSGEHQEAPNRAFIRERGDLVASCMRLAVDVVLQGTADSSKPVAIAARMDMARDDITPENDRQR